MKKLIVIAALLITTALSHAGGGTTAVTDARLKILAAPGRYGVAPAVGTAYTAGRATRGYLCLASGTATVTPSGTTDVTDGSLVWRFILSDIRSALFIRNTGTDSVTIWWDGTVADGAGILLTGGEALIMTEADATQTSIYAVCATGESTTIISMEW